MKHHRIIAGASALAIAAIPAAAASAAKDASSAAQAKTRSFNMTIKFAKNDPASGDLTEGRFTNGGFGPGTATGKLEIGNFEGKLQGRTTILLRPRRGGTITIYEFSGPPVNDRASGTWRVVKGTGPWKGVKGNGTFTAKTDVLEYRLKGKVSRLAARKKR